MSRRPRAALFVPILFLLMGVGFIAGAVANLAKHFTVIGLLPLAVSVGVLVVVLGEIRLVYESKGRILVGRPFDFGRYDARVCAFTITTYQGPRGGVTYDVYGGNTTRRTKVSFHGTPRAAGRAVRRLTTDILGVDERVARAESLVVVDSLRQAERDRREQGRAYQRAYYRDHPALKWIMIGIVVAVITTAVAEYAIEIASR